ncbi:MAG: magnesium chelatase, partial [bacterium]|nr:magnesium chelatase [bacterium]
VGGFDAGKLDTAGVTAILDAERLLGLQQAVSSVRVDEELLDYITEIVGRTRAHRSIYLGASPRASIAMLTVARVRAAAEARDYVIPDDIKQMARPILRHRLVLHPDAEIEGMSADDCIDGILREATVPHTTA